MCFFDGLPPPTQSQLHCFYFPFPRKNINFSVLTRRKVNHHAKDRLHVSSPFPSAWVLSLQGDPHLSIRMHVLAK